MNHIYLSLGSNIEPEKHLRCAMAALAQYFSDIESSPVYETPAFGFSGPCFLNSVVAAYTDQTITEVIATLKAIEVQQGRQRQQEKFSSRTLDIDLLLYNDCVTTRPIVLPREEIYHRSFVLKPLSDLAPHKVDPVLKTTYLELWASFEGSRQLKTVAF